MDSKKKYSVSKPTFYGDSVEVVHANERNYNRVKSRSSKNFVMTSNLSQFDAPIKPVGLGIKYVAQGQESYRIGKKHFPIISGHYILLNESIPSVDVLIKNEVTLSVCVDIDPILVNDVLDQIIHPNDINRYEDFQRYLLTPELLVRQAKGSAVFQTLLNNFLNHGVPLNNNPRAVELIYEITGTLIRENFDLIKSCYQIKVSRPSTRKELFSRLLLGRDMLNDSIYSKTTISEIAQACSISEFRFFRLFRQCFGVTPYDYYLTLKVKKSVELRKEGLSWGEISHVLNFNDLSAFNKAFKKVYKVAPSIAEKQLHS